MSLELNKIAASILTAGVVVMGSQFMAEVLVSPEIPEEPVYAPELNEPNKTAKQTGSGSGEKEQTADKTESGEAGKAESGKADKAESGETETAKAGGETGKTGGGSGKGGGMVAMLASADAEAGKSATTVCKACHSFNKGGPNKIGPNLYGVVGNDIASHEGFNYSDALKGKEGKWTIEKLSKYLKAPNDWAPGNKMSYQGIKDDQKRANVIEYLRQNDDSPMPLPESASGSDSGEASQDKASAGGDSGAAEKADAEGDAAASDGQKATSDGQKKAETSGSADATQTAKAEGSAPAGGASNGAGGEFATMIANASAAKGEAASAVCKACHSFAKGGPHKIGPNLYNVLNRGLGKAEGFSYTDALKSKGDKWTYKMLWNYLENPQKWAKGTNMSYAGVKDSKKRANLIAYLRQQGETPPKLPN